jgi:hypothetical protein
MSMFGLKFYRNRRKVQRVAIYARFALRFAERLQRF